LKTGPGSGLLSLVPTSGIHRRARRALDRQLDYQRRKAASIEGHEQELIAKMTAHSLQVRQKLERVAPIPDKARVLEVGSGAHGLIFYFEAAERIGVDPLADHYQALFPEWQHRATTIAASGSDLPFENGRFDVVLCDNVVDHASDPRKIVEEIARVLRPGGLLYFTVNVHHRAWHWAASLHAAWRAVGIPFEIAPFADHTVHLTLDAARRLFSGLPFRTVVEDHDIEQVKREGPDQERHFGDRLKRWFFKNARYELIAERR
jgi:SAM-dependent methyltransferase